MNTNERARRAAEKIQTCVIDHRTQFECVPPVADLTRIIAAEFEDLDKDLWELKQLCHNHVTIANASNDLPLLTLSATIAARLESLLSGNPPVIHVGESAQDDSDLGQPQEPDPEGHTICCSRCERSVLLPFCDGSRDTVTLDPLEGWHGAPTRCPRCVASEVETAP